MSPGEPLYSLADLRDLAAELGMTDYEGLDYQSLMKSIIVAQGEKLSEICRPTGSRGRST